MSTKVDHSARQRAELRSYEADNDIVPGTASWKGDSIKGAPAGGLEWEGLARMALARLPDDRTDDDVEALRRYPNPRCSLTGRPLSERSAAELEAERAHRACEPQRVETAAGYEPRERADL